MGRTEGEQIVTWCIVASVDALQKNATESNKTMYNMYKTMYNIGLFKMFSHCIFHIFTAQIQSQ